MKAFLNSIPGMNILLSGIGIFIAVFILICYISFVLAIWEEEEVIRRQKRLEAKRKKERENDDESTEDKCNE